jgi:hypothetical protein
MGCWGGAILMVADRWAEPWRADNIQDIAVFVQTKDKSHQGLKEG